MKRTRKRIVRLLTVLLGAWLTLSWVFMWSPVYWYSATPCSSICLNTLRQIEKAKDQWAIDHRKLSGDAAPVEDVNAYVKGGGRTKDPYEADPFVRVTINHRQFY